MKARLLQVLAYLVVLAFGNFTWYVAMAVYDIKPGEISFLTEKDELSSMPEGLPIPVATSTQLFLPNAPAPTPQPSATQEDDDVEITLEMAEEYDPYALAEFYNRTRSERELDEFYCAYGEALAPATNLLCPGAIKARPHLINAFQQLAWAASELYGGGTLYTHSGARLVGGLEKMLYEATLNGYELRGCYREEVNWAEPLVAERIAEVDLNSFFDENKIIRRHAVLTHIHQSKAELEEALKFLPPEAAEFFYIDWNVDVKSWFGGEN